MSIQIKEKKLKEQSTIVSKYYSPETQQMDESLSDFKTPKKKMVAPTTDKAVKSKKPAAKATKKKTVKSKGQKDIRVALKSQVSELEGHSRDFQNICTENGVDVDPEHLQLAIALSRSLHEFHGISDQENTEIPVESSAVDSQNSDDLSQTSHVRKALEKYGFVFPTSNTTRTTNQDLCKRKPASRRRKKSSALLKITPQERKEKVIDKISKVLLTSLNNSLKQTSNEHNVTIQYQKNSQCSKSITDRSTCSYIDVLQNDREFYVNDIVEESNSKVGCLLRDWSAILGREKSPEREVNIVVRPFQEYITNQVDLDTLLSGIFQKCIFNINDCVSGGKSHSLMTKTDSPIPKKSMDCPVHDKHSENLLLQNDLYGSKNTANGFLIAENRMDSLGVAKPKEFRSFSPDIFDDDENDGPRHEISTTESNDEKMPEVTLNRCLMNKFTPISSKKTVLCEVTQRRSNDYMDLTECIPTFIKDKSANKFICTDNISVNLTSVDNLMCTENSDNIDLTQSSGESVNALENRENANLQTTQINKLYAEEFQCESNSLFVEKKVIDNFDLTQSSSNSLNLSIKNNMNDNYEKNKIECQSKNLDNSQSSTLLKQEKVLHLDLTQSSGDSLNLSIENYNNSVDHEKLNNKSIDLTQNYSPINITQNNKDSPCFEENSLVYDSRNERNDITDLTQSYNEEVEFENILQSDINTNFVCHDQEINSEDFLLEKSFNNICLTSLSCNDLEKSNQSLNLRKANTSDRIDSFQNNNKSSRLKNISIDKEDCENEESSFSSQNSNGNVFEISDEELNYSMQNYKDVKEKSTNVDDLNILKDKRCSELIKSAQKSKTCNFDIGGSSIFDGISIDSLNTENELGISNAKHNYSRVLNNKSRSIDCHEITESSLFLPDVKIGGIQSVKSVEISNERVEDDNNLYTKKTEDIFSNFGTINNFSTPKSNKNNVVSNVTPCNNQYMVKMTQITPMMDYRSMTSPDRNSELEKYGIKPFKRKRAVQLLEHIYYQTHPTIDGNEELADSVCRSLKRRRLSESAAVNSTIKLIDTSPLSTQKYHHESKDIMNKNFDLLKKTARRSFQKSISENHFGNKPTTSEIHNANLEIQNDIIKSDFLADNSIKHEKNKEISEVDINNKPKIQSKMISKSSKNKPKSDNLLEDNLEVRNDNLFDELIFGNEPKSCTSKSSNSPRKNKNAKSDKGTKNVLKDFNLQHKIPEHIENDDILYPVTNWKPVLKEIYCESSDWVFQKREKAKVLGCRVPLHIAFHNYMSARPALRAAILRYEPINIDEVHKGLLQDGHRYDAKDILRFMDKKCITVKTSDNNARNANQQKKPKQPLSQKYKR